MMKILAYRHEVNFKFESLLHALSKTKYKIGYTKGEITKENIKEFNPDIILHNIPDTTSFPVENRAVSINFNDTDAKNSFSLSNESLPNFIEPFVSLKKVSSDIIDPAKYDSDVMYIGSPSVFNRIVHFVTNPENNILFKFFSNNFHNINGYCGLCRSDDYYKFYNRAKCSLVKEDDRSRIMDIIASDGNPIVYNGNNDDECIDKIKRSVKDGEKYSVDGYTKDDIINRHTSFDRLSSIFKTVGLNKISDEIMKQKSGSW